WFKWTASSGNTASFDTSGSDFDTLLAVYTGSSVSGLTPVTANDNNGTSLQSKVGFVPVSGSTYMIAVDGHNGAAGSLVLNWTQSNMRPPNDDFASAQVISGTNAQVIASSVNATKEPGEPNHAGVAGGASIWFAWTAPANLPVIFETIGSSFDTT